MKILLRLSAIAVAALTASLLTMCDPVSDYNMDDEYTLVKPGDTVPSFKITDTGGGHTFNSDQRVKPVVIYFFWSECPDCHNQTPKLLSLTDGNGEIAGIELVCIARGGSNATLEQAKTYWATNKPPLYYDDGRAVYSLFAVQNVPRLYFIDRNGVIRHSSSTIMEAADIAAFIDDIR